VLSALAFFCNFGYGNWRQAEAWIVLHAGAVEVNALAQGALRQFTQCLRIEHPTFQLRGGHFTTELCRPGVPEGIEKFDWQTGVIIATHEETGFVHCCNYWAFPSLAFLEKFESMPWKRTNEDIGPKLEDTQNVLSWAYQHKTNFYSPAKLSRNLRSMPICLRLFCWSTESLRPRPSIKAL